MSWSTVAGLAVILALAGLAARVYFRASDKREKDRLKTEIDACERTLTHALNDDPSNLALHARLRASLRRLQEQLDALG